MGAARVFEGQSDGSGGKCGGLGVRRLERKGQRKALQAPLSRKEGSVAQGEEVWLTAPLASCRGPREDVETPLVHPDRQLSLLLRIHHCKQGAPEPAPAPLPTPRLVLISPLTELGAPLRSFSPPPHPFHRGGN